MWDALSYLLAFGLIMLVLHYTMDPAQLFKDIRELRGSNQKINELEQRIAELEN